MPPASSEVTDEQDSPLRNVRFYRIALTNPTRRFDFTSNEERGNEPRRPLSPRDRDRWRGVSFYSSLEATRAKVHESPWLGDFIAVVEIPVSRFVRIEQTDRDRDHYTIWADASDRFSWVVPVVPVHEVE